jgi:hypothetical protein
MESRDHARDGEGLLGRDQSTLGALPVTKMTKVAAALERSRLLKAQGAVLDLRDQCLRLEFELQELRKITAKIRLRNTVSGTILKIASSFLRRC